MLSTISSSILSLIRKCRSLTPSMSLTKSYKSRSEFLVLSALHRRTATLQLSIDMISLTQVCLPVFSPATKTICSYGPCLAFLLSFLRARSLRFFFLDLFLNGIFPHSIQRRNAKKVYVLPITIANYKY